MHILITNDDGIFAPGLKTLVKEALKYGRVTVIAPKVEQSAKSHCIQVRTPIEFKKIDDIVEGVDTYYADSTPADCVRIAYFYMNLDFDIVFSGINAGFNVGEDITYSGTCAAATEAAMLGKKAVAFSCGFEDVENIDKEVEKAIEYVFRNKLLEKYALYNINMPTNAKGIMLSRQGHTHYFSYYENNNGYLSSLGRPEATEDDIELSDVDLIYKKYITITPLNFLRTNEDILKILLDESKNFK